MKFNENTIHSVTHMFEIYVQFHSKINKLFSGVVLANNTLAQIIQINMLRNSDTLINTSKLCFLPKCSYFTLS